MMWVFLEYHTELWPYTGWYEKDINTNFPRGQIPRFPILSLKRLKNQKWNEKENFLFCHHVASISLSCAFRSFCPRYLSSFSYSRLWGIGEMVEWSASIFFISFGIVFLLFLSALMNLEHFRLSENCLSSSQLEFCIFFNFFCKSFINHPISRSARFSFQLVFVFHRKLLHMK